MVVGIEFLRGGDILCGQNVSGVATNVSLIPAVTGQIIRVFGFNIVGTTATPGTVSFKSGSGGPLITTAIGFPANTSATPNTFFPITESGYFQVNAAGVGLFCDIAGAGAAVNVFYKVFSP